MQTVLFHSTIYGPIHSRRLGMSLGINLMPNDGKMCSFDCLYCEAGFNAQGPGKDGIPSREAVKKQLRSKLTEMKQAGQTLDVITFSGNGEPTLHPDFKKVVEARLGNSDLSVDDLAAAMNLSRVQLYRKVKTISGSSPVELLRTARLNKGYQLLLTTGKNVSEVAYDVGFTAPSYFTKCFKDEFGVSPSDLQAK